MRIALYPGSFDPVTNGHIDIIERALLLFDELVVGIGINLAKEPLFSIEERLELLESSIGKKKNVRIASYEGLTAKFAREIGAVAILRGLRAISDFEHEFQMALANRKIESGIETVFLMPSLPNVYLNSSMVKTIASLGGNVREFVPKSVFEKLKRKFK